MLVVLGTRPEAIKLAPVVRAMRRRGLALRLCVTAQHRSLLDHALGDDLRPDIDLDLMSHGQSPAALVASMAAALDRVLGAERPDRVVVQGDTATALAAAQSAFLRNIPVAHVEAGLRTGDLDQPWPEEGIRRAITCWSDLHFAPTLSAVAALKGEGVHESSIHMVGNTVVDAVQAQVRRGGLLCPQIRGLLDQAGDRRVMLVTCHRRENLGAGLQRIAEAVRQLAVRPDIFIIIPAHPNPKVRDPLSASFQGLGNVALIEPLPFGPFLQLLKAVHLTLSDSGGVQEEAPLLGSPVLVARNVTERMEGVEAGTAILVGTCPDRIVRETERLLDDTLHHARMSRVHSPYGDGRAAERIAAIIASIQAGPLAHASAE